MLAPDIRSEGEEDAETNIRGRKEEGIKGR